MSTLSGGGPLCSIVEQRLLRRRRALDEHVGRIDSCGPHRLERLRRVAPLHHDVDRPGGRREAQRLLERPVRLRGLGRGHPLAVDRRIAARVKDAAGRVAHLETVLAEIGVVDRPRRAARPRQRLDHDAVDGEDLGALASGVREIEPHRRRLRGWRRKHRKGGEQDCETGEQAAAAHVSGSAWSRTVASPPSLCPTCAPLRSSCDRSRVPESCAPARAAPVPAAPSRPGAAA